MFDSVVGQAQVKENVERMLRSGALPHALLFTGPEGVGKTELAIALAARLLCENGPQASCTECRGCRRAMRLEHPDLHILFPFRAPPDSSERRDTWAEELIARRNRLRDEPYAPVAYEQGRVIVRDLVDEVRDRLLQTALEGGRKVCIILLAERLNPTTGNLLLKILEEPPADVQFILTAERLSGVLPTIVSRCAVVPFRRLRQDEIECYLAGSGELAHDAAVSYAEAAAGSLKTARALAFEDRAAVLERSRELFANLARGQAGAVFETSSEFLWSRDISGAEELLKGFAQCTRELLGRRYGISRPLAAGAVREVGLDRIDSLAKQIETGLEMLRRYVAVSTVLTMVFLHIQETFADA
jgi:DNA polymerase-3 subunit delta'